MRTVLDLLRLLAERADGDASADELERAAAELASEPEAGALALRVLAAMDAGRRRESELAALVGIARDLASESDTGSVLDTIVRRARALLGTDVAYLTLYDAEHGDTYMRVTSGSVSRRFQTLRLPLGAGLGGLVAASRTPHWTGRYAGDDRYRHTEAIDTAVGEEGIVAICGTPLLVDDEFVGVLFAANRSARPFTPDDVALLGSLAALAAVSLVQTRRLADTAATLEALRGAHAAIAEAADAHDRFAGVVLEGGDVGDIAEALGRLLGGWVTVVDLDGTPAARYGPVPPDLDVAAALRRADDERGGDGAGRPVTVPCAGGARVVAVVAGGQRLGTLLLGGIGGGRGPGPAELSPAQVRTVERAAMVTALVLLFTQRADEADRLDRADGLAELLGAAGPPRPATLARLAALGVSVHRPHLLLVCRSHPARRRALAREAATLGGRSGLVAEREGALVVLLPGDDPAAAGARLARPSSEQDPDAGVTVGAAGPFRPADGADAALGEARRAAEALLALDRAGESAAAADLGFAGLLLGDRPDVAGYVDGILGPVAEHDERRGSDLLHTLEAYYATGASPTRAAARLHVHVNTVAQRLERIGTLLGPGWQDPERSLEVQLALRLHRLGASGRQ
ncbi:MULTISPECIES: helix-turn-helix domain-containing protein [unclassified Pseudonocardia]|uniref:helix-turn-helix domain-containing protein n=1 Tax=unclassified Pseudonocardia TaxID=2619320 RepID=UPI000760D1C2|nr:MULTISPECIES: helix-turn-helix domain-containing protein [unclassified Pseudonocardia]OLM17536.1 Regulator of polyketide synthase expression [Pseudonocardia sp. Ae707_Ps1]